MNNSKEKVHRRVFCCFFALGVFAFLGASAVVAQETQAEGQNEEYRFVVEETLDEAEKSFDPAGTEEDSSSEDLSSEGWEAPVDEYRLTDIAEEGESVEALEPSPNALEMKIIPLLHAEAAGMIEVLNGMKSPDGNVKYNEEDRTLVLEDHPEALVKMSDFIRETDVLLETKVFKLKYIPAENVAPAVRQHLTKNIGQIEVGKDGKTVVVTDTPLVIGVVTELVRGLDVFNAEVVVGIHVIEIILNDEHPDGVDWEAIVSGYQKLARAKEAGGEAESLKLGTVSREDYEILLEALDTVGVVSALFEEDKAIDNETAGILDCPVSSEGDEALRVFLTPTIKKEEPLQIGIKVSGAESENVMLQMNDGETLILGGVFEDLLLSSPWKIPLLGDLPLLGFVFRNEGQELRKAEVVIFLTVKIKEKTI